MASPTSPGAALLSCPECDLVQRATRLAAGQSALCGRCGATLYRAPRPGRALPLTLAAFVAFGVALAFPIVGLEVQGNLVEATLPGAARALYDDGMSPLALLVGATTVIYPLVALAALALLQHPRLRQAPALRRALRAAQPWSMLEVFVLGVLVALAKLAHMATVVPGVGALALGALVVLWAAAYRASGL
jgi:paraquat-inducible protein A